MPLSKEDLKDPNQKMKRCIGCLSLMPRDENPCTKFQDYTRKELIKMFNEMLEFYGHKKI